MSWITENAEVEKLADINWLRYSPDIITTAAGVHLLNANDSYLHVCIGSAAGQVLRLPDATTVPKLGAAILVHNHSSASLKIEYQDGSTYLDPLNPGGRMIVFLINQSTANGVWIRSVQSSSAFQGTAPILGYYGGNANTGRYLEIYPSEPSNTGPILIPAPETIICVTLAGTGLQTGTVGVFKLTDLVNPLVSISLANEQKKILTGLNIPLLELEEVCFRVTAGSINKPRFTMYISGA